MTRSMWVATLGTLLIGAHALGACEVTLTDSNLREEAMELCKTGCAAMVASDACQQYYQGGNLPSTAAGCDAVCADTDQQTDLVCVSEYHDLQECLAAVSTAEFDAFCAAPDATDPACAQENQKYSDCNFDIPIDDDDGGYGGFGGTSSTASASGGAGGGDGVGGDGGR